MDNPLKRELVFLHGNHRPQCEAIVNKHYIGYYTLQYITEGKVELFYNDNRYTLHPGTFWMGYPGPLIRFHSAFPGAFWNHRYIAFTGVLVQRWEGHGLIPRIPVETDGNPSWAREMDSIIEEGFKLHGYAQYRAINRLENILYSLAEYQRSQEPANEWVNEIVRIILKQGYFPDYSAAAEQMHISERTMRRRFHRLMGISIHEYLIQLRLQEASTLLWKTELSISEVAGKLGYRDVYFFSRQFKSRMRVTPTEFRHSRE